MSRPNPVFSFIYRLLLELPARGKTYEKLVSRLEFSGQMLGVQLPRKADTPANRARLCHIIGIERWGQRRLEMLLGEPPVSDEYDSYMPDETKSLSTLVEMFLRTRAESVGIAWRLQHNGVPVSARVLHNHTGPLSVAGWLTYFVQHANFEARRIKK
jgi:hypothetical protein